MTHRWSEIKHKGQRSMEARLLTRDGHFVADIELPFFHTPPQVVVWGDRHFQLYQPPTPLSGLANTIVQARTGKRIYREVFAWYYTPLAGSEREEPE